MYLIKRLLNLITVSLLNDFIISPQTKKYLWREPPGNRQNSLIFLRYLHRYITRFLSAGNVRLHSRDSQRGWLIALRITSRVCPFVVPVKQNRKHGTTLQLSRHNLIDSHAAFGLGQKHVSWSLPETFSTIRTADNHLHIVICHILIGCMYKAMYLFK